MRKIWLILVLALSGRAAAEVIYREVEELQGALIDGMSDVHFFPSGGPQHNLLEGHPSAQGATATVRFGAEYGYRYWYAMLNISVQNGEICAKYVPPVPLFGDDDLAIGEPEFWDGVDFAVGGEIRPDSGIWTSVPVRLQDRLAFRVNPSGDGSTYYYGWIDIVPNSGFLGFQVFFDGVSWVKGWGIETEPNTNTVDKWATHDMIGNEKA